MEIDRIVGRTAALAVAALLAAAAGASEVPPGKPAVRVSQVVVSNPSGEPVDVDVSADYPLYENVETVRTNVTREATSDGSYAWKTNIWVTSDRRLTGHSSPRTPIASFVAEPGLTVVSNVTSEVDVTEGMRVFADVSDPRAVVTPTYAAVSGGGGGDGSRIVTGEQEIRADLTAKVLVWTDRWEPSHTPIPSDPNVGDTYYEGVSWSDPYASGDFAWYCLTYEWYGSEWIPVGPYLLGFDRDATELTFPDDVTVTRRVSEIVETRLATTNDLASKVDRGTRDVVVGEGAGAVDDYENYRIAIGKGAKAQQGNSLSIGREAYATRFSSVAIGTYAVSTNQNAVSIGRSARSHGVDTFNVAASVGMWYAGDVPLVDALFSTGYSESYVEEVVTNEAPPMASGRLAAGPFQVVTNRFRVYVPDPSAPKPVLEGRETAADLAAMLADVNTNSTEHCDCARSNLTEFVKGPVNSVKDRHWDAGLGVEWTFVSDGGEFMFVATTNVNMEVLQ